MYSGDTRPSDAVVDLGIDLPACRILVHEATFDDTDEMRREAVDRRHSTINEALLVGSRMGAWRVVLTHFSQRYPKLPDVREAAANTIVAFDNMRVPFSLLPQLPQLTPALVSLLRDELGGDEAGPANFGPSGAAGVPSEKL